MALIEQQRSCRGRRSYSRGTAGIRIVPCAFQIGSVSECSALLQGTVYEDLRVEVCSRFPNWRIPRRQPGTANKVVPDLASGGQLNLCHFAVVVVIN